MPEGNKELKERIHRSLTSQRWPTTTVLSSLLAAHDELGYLPNEAIEQVAAFNDATINDVWGVASFYTNFRFDPPGNHLVEICWGPTCHLLGASHILERVQLDLGLEGEGETTDNNITLKYNTCLGACSQAPVISVDHLLYGRMDPESTNKVLAEIPKPA